MLPTCPPKPTQTQAHLFGNLPAERKFLGSWTSPNCSKQSKYPHTAWDCASDVFLNQYFHQYLGNKFTHGISESWAEPFSFIEAINCLPAQTHQNARVLNNDKKTAGLVKSYIS